MIHLIAYDLHNPGRDYEDVIAQIKMASGGYFHLQGSVWLIDTRSDPEWWRDQLKERGDSNDEYFVVRLQRDWSGFNMGGGGEWLNDPARRW